MDKLFKLSLRGTDKKTEIIAGLTTFMTMAYVLAVQPAAICGGEAYITDVNGVVITKSAIMITCALVSGLITLLMAFYTNFPFALSTGMGSNFILGALIQSQALSFGAAMVITLISGIVFVLLTVFGLRDLIVRVIPKNIKIAISASIGFFIAYLGFKNCGIGSFENGIALGNLTDPAVLLAIGGIGIAGFAGVKLLGRWGLALLYSTVGVLRQVELRKLPVYISGRVVYPISSLTMPGLRAKLIINATSQRLKFLESLIASSPSDNVHGMQILGLALTFTVEQAA